MVKLVTTHRTGLSRFLTTTAVCALLSPVTAMAQDSGGGDSAPYEDVVIVVGTAGGKGVNRFDASFAVSSFDASDLEKIQPKSTADLLKSVPGIWAESSGGVAGANIYVRGLPSDGDAPFVSFALNGSPLFGFNTLSFLEGSTLFRIDDTIQSVEALRGGPNAVFAKGEPGATINFRLREGGDSFQGRAKYTTSDYNLHRFDAYASGPLADDLYYMIGGYIQRSPGIRDAEFVSEKGQQFTVQLTKFFDDGKVNVYSRITDDHGQWYLPFNLANAGIDAGTFSQLGNATRQRRIQIGLDDDTGVVDLGVFDFGDGRGWNGQVSGANLEFDFGDGFTLRNNVNYLSGDANTLGFVSAGAAVPATALTTPDGEGNRIVDGPVRTAGGQTLGAGDFVQTYGHWVVLKDIEHFSNDLSLSRTFGDHDVTAGYYTSTFSADDWWSIGNPVAVHNIANGDLLDGVTPADIAAAGGDAGFRFGLASAGDAQVNAVYIADSWQVADRLRLDAGFRYENIEIDYTLDTGPGFPDGTRDKAVSIEENEISWTVAADFEVSDVLGTFVRFSDGFAFPHFDNIREDKTGVFDIQQLEGGLKYSGEYLSAFATVFRNTNDSFSSVVGGAEPATTFETEAIGIELDGVVTVGAFSTAVTATFQNAEITAADDGALVDNRVQRQPEWQFRVSPDYTIDFGDGGTATLYGTATFVGDRYGNNANTVDLPSYEKFDLGVLVNFDSGLFFQVHGDNLTDSDGITEGDPRSPTAPNGRPILGTSVKFTVGYDF